METIAKTTTQPIKIIYNNDVAVLDFIAELKDRDNLLRAIDDFNKKMKSGPHKNFMLLYKAKQDNLVILILCNASFIEKDENENKYLLYAHPSLRKLCIYFNNYYQNIQSSDEKILRELEGIQRFLTYQWAREDEQNTPGDFRG